MWFFSNTPEQEQETQSPPPPPPVEPESLPKDPTKKTQIVFWNSFQLPITYLPEQHSLSQTVATDLELLPPTPEQNSIYKHLLLDENSSTFAKQMTTQWSQQFTTNTDFLLETQQMIQNLPPITPPSETETTPEKDIQKTWEEITLTEDFKEKFNYLEFKYLEPFNHNSAFLECLNLIHLSTPILSLIMFIFFIFLPIFLMTYSKSPFNIETYVLHMASLAKVSFMGKMAKSAVFNGWYHYQTLGMVVGCLIFYGVQFYNSYISYYRFWRNVELVNQHLITVREYIQSVIPKMKAFLQTCHSTVSKTYQPFCQKTAQHLEQLESIQNWLQHVQPYSYSIAKCYDFGNMFQCYYEFHTNHEFDKSIRYATGFQGFWENIYVLKTRLEKQTVSFAVFPTEAEIKAMESIPGTSIADAKKVDNQLYGMYYPAHSKEEAIRNDCDLAENWIITGPNASGKTTYLKTVALNLIFTQQFGMGFYRHCVIYHPYTQFYTYLNIPDTSDRDSLFQAEVRRGKEILDAVSITAAAAVAPSSSETPNNNFLLMDELFSGTNHDDAVQAAYGFLCYLGHPMRQSSTRFLLTTHFVEICDKIQSKAPHVAKNGKMIIEEIGFVNSGTDKPEKKEEILEESEKSEEPEGKEEDKTGEELEDGESDNKIPEPKEEEKEKPEEKSPKPEPEPEKEKPREIGELGEIKYLYQFKEGISRLRCGIHILKQMKYPTEVMCYL